MKLTTVHYIGLAVAAAAIAYLLFTMTSSSSNSKTEDYDFEGFEDSMPTAEDEDDKKELPEPETPTLHENKTPSVEGFYGGFDRKTPSFASPGGVISGQKGVPSSDYANCYTRDGLNPTDLLPKPSAEASQFLASNPPAPGSADARNMLDAGYHFGIDTVSQSNKNPNLQLRSDPPIPRCGTQPIFNGSSIPAVQNNRRVLEIGAELNPSS